jgi:hypothetical protein
MWTCVASILFAVVYFVICILIDHKKMSAYRTPDNRQPTFHPRYLDADDDVLKEAARVASDRT